MLSILPRSGLNFIIFIWKMMKKNPENPVDPV